MSAAETGKHPWNGSSASATWAGLNRVSDARVYSDAQRDDLAAVRLLVLVGGLTDEQRAALAHDAGLTQGKLAAGSGIMEQRLAAVRKVIDEIQLEDIVEQYKGLRGDEAARFRSETESFRSCQRMAADNGKHLSLVRFLVMQQLATLSDIDNALIASGAVRRALAYMGDAAPPREGAQTSIVQALTRDELVARRDASALTLRSITQEQATAASASCVRKKASRILRYGLAAGGFAAVLLGAYVLYWHDGADRVMREAVYRDIDFSDFSSARNRRQHLVNLAGLCRVMDDCARYDDGEGVQRSLQAIAAYMATVEKRDPAFATETPDLYKEVMAYKARAHDHVQ